MTVSDLNLNVFKIDINDFKKLSYGSLTHTNSQSC